MDDIYNSILVSFYEKNMERQFTSCERDLFLYLLCTWAKFRKGNVRGNIKGNVFPCSTIQTERDLSMPRKTIIQCRRKLCERGLITFQEGKGKSNNPYYFFNEVTEKVTEKVTVAKEEISPTPPKEENNIYNINHQQQLCARTHEKNLEDLKEVLMKASQWLESVRMALFRNYKIAMTEDEIKEKLSDYFVHLQSEGIEVKTEQDAKSHFKNWIAKVHEIENKKQQQQHGASNNKIGGQHSTDPGTVQEQPINIYKEVFGYDGPPDKFEEWFNRNPYGG